jgi:hypothetical protein
VTLPYAWRDRVDGPVAAEDLYECGVCYALIQEDGARLHLQWHDEVSS